MQYIAQQYKFLGTVKETNFETVKSLQNTFSEYVCLSIHILRKVALSDSDAGITPISMIVHSTMKF